MNNLDKLSVPEKFLLSTTKHNHPNSRVNSTDMFSVIFLIIFAFEFTDTLPYGKENNDYG